MAAASASPDVEYCNAKTRRGTPCRKPAGAGTDHVGFGNCKLHGGATPNGKLSAAKQAATSLAVELDIEPHEALLRCVRIAYGEVVFLNRKVEELQDDKLVVDHIRIRRHEGDASSFVERTSHSDLNIWIRARNEAVERLARYSKLAIDAGVDERRVRLEEQLVGDLANAIDMVLTELGVRDHPDAPKVVRRALTLVEAPKPLERAKDAA